MPFFAPASMAMLHMVKRSAIDSCETPGPPNSIDWYSAPSTPIWPMIHKMTSLPDTQGERLPVKLNRMALGTRNHARPVTIAAARSVDPTPVENAPSAPYVQVWLSAPMTASPEATRPCSGRSACSMPIEPTSKKFESSCSRANVRHVMHCSALFMSLFGTKWSMIRQTLDASNTLVKPLSRKTLIAIGAVTSFAKTKSR